MYQWADENIENIKFFYVSTEDITSHTSIIQNRLTVAETIDRTLVFDQVVKQSLSYIPCQLMRYLLLKMFIQAKGYL